MIRHKPSESRPWVVIVTTAPAMGSGSSTARSSAAPRPEAPPEVMMITPPPSAPAIHVKPPPEPSGEISFLDSLDIYGTYKFKGAVAAPFLTKQGLPADVLSDMQWTHVHAEKVAKAVLEWAKSKGATMVTHWFQPLGSSGIRMGQSGQVHNAMFNFDSQGKPIWCFEAGELLKGETDGSSYLNGGMRATHTAGGYTALDPTSPMFIRGDTLFIPTVFVSFYGKALDEKTPLLRAMQAMSKSAVRLLSLLGHTCKEVLPMCSICHCAGQPAMSDSAGV